jgi:hypothetical protein
MVEVFAVGSVVFMAQPAFLWVAGIILFLWLCG